VRLIRDRDSICGSAFDARVRNLGIEQLVVARRSPWQNGYAERFVGTLRRELLDQVIVLGERHLLRLVRRHTSYYNEDRPDMALDRDAPVTRAVQPPSSGKVGSLPRFGGLHHRYSRAASIAEPVLRHDNRHGADGPAPCDSGPVAGSRVTCGETITTWSKCDDRASNSGDRC
jgi:hypothetical protein